MLVVVPSVVIMTGRKGHYLVGNRTVGPQTYNTSHNSPMEKRKTQFLWIKHGLVVQMRRKNTFIWCNG